MAEFRVWAPERSEPIRLKLGERTIEMHRDGDWYAAIVPDLQSPTDYSFIVEGTEVPDPRSMFQPNGVHGTSRTIDHGTFAWTDSGWKGFDLSKAILYELHIGTFTPEGTFEAAAEKLGHIVDLGATVIELMPVAEFAGKRGWGYDSVDLFAVHHSYGGPEGLKRLVNACHENGLGVVMDVVYNHLGPAGNYLARFGPYFTDRYTTPWGAAVNLDGPHSYEVRKFFIDNALMWLEDYHCDGLRLDAVHAFYDRSAVHFLEELNLRVEELESEIDRKLHVIAESDLNDPRLIWERGRGGYGLDAVWSDDFHHSLHSLLTGETKGYYQDFGSVSDVAQALKHAYVYDGRFSNYRRRTHGRPIETTDGGMFLAYLQTHDQVGNRAKGERSSALMNVEQLKIGAALVLTSPFVPMIFQGEEWGASTPFMYFTDHDEELGKLVSEGRRREFASFGWSPDDVPDPQAIDTFERSKLNWGDITRPPHAELLQWHKDLISLRNNQSSLKDHDLARVRTVFNEKPAWLLVERAETVTAVNFSEQPVQVDLATEYNVLISSGDVGRDGSSIKLPPQSVAILETTG
jgi:maltooligosyltrehalose trehalohydrolase